MTIRARFSTKPAPNFREIACGVIQCGSMLKASSISGAVFVSTVLALTLPQQENTQTQQHQPAATTQPGVTVENDVQYGSANGVALLLDLYEPAGPAADLHPAVILIHGGGWTDLDKSTMRTMGQFLARSGFTAFSVDYRLFDGKQNRWPVQLDDVQRAVRWIRANAAKYHIRTERIGAFGHSAGAQLAALLGMEDTRDNSDPALAKYPSRVQAVVDVDGPTDFTAERDSEGEFLASFFGAPYSQDPALWQAASPVFHAAKGDAPFLIVHGTRDESVPISQAQELYDKLQSAGVPVQFVKVDDAHTFKTAEARRTLAIDALEFFNRYLVVTQ